MRKAGWRHSEATKEKIRAARLGRRHSVEAIQKMCDKAQARDYCGANNPAWRGGTTAERSGRVKVLQDDGTYRYRARIVLEAVLGRRLLDSEDAHHLNGIKSDDRPENLIAIDRAEHARRHIALRQRNKAGQVCCLSE